VKVCALGAWPFQSQQSGALTGCGGLVQPSEKECAIGAIHCKKEGMLVTLL